MENVVGKFSLSKVLVQNFSIWWRGLWMWQIELIWKRILILIISLLESQKPISFAHLLNFWTVHCWGQPYFDWNAKISFCGVVDPYYTCTLLNYNINKFLSNDQQLQIFDTVFHITCTVQGPPFCTSIYWMC